MICSDCKFYNHINNIEMACYCDYYNSPISCQCVSECDEFKSKDEMNNKEAIEELNFLREEELSKNNGIEFNRTKALKMAISALQNECIYEGKMEEKWNDTSRY